MVENFSGESSVDAMVGTTRRLDIEPPYTREPPARGVLVDMAQQTDASSPPLQMLVTLIDEFHCQKVSYCYWKSSRRIYIAMAGETDLDLLVARGDQYRAQKILLERGFKLFPEVAARSDPAIWSYFGYDEPTGQIVHVHLHLQLVAGNSLLRNYRLPWEEMVLTRSVQHGFLPIRVLDATSEALLLMIRACLELRRSDPVMFRNWHAAQRKFSLDHAALVDRVSIAEFRERASEAVGAEIADRLASAFFGNHELVCRLGLRWRVMKMLAPFRTYNALEAHIRSTWRGMLWIAGGLNDRLFYLPRPWSRRAPGGGCVVAILGVDGSGKTTLNAAIRSWLRSAVNVMPVYFGTGAGRPSLLLLPLKMIVPVISPWLKRKQRRGGIAQRSVSRRAPNLLYDLLLMVWATVVAIEKRRKLLAAHRGAKRGLVVITDRYPQNEILGFNDGPRLFSVPAAPQWLSRFEATAYALARRMPPDLVIKLRMMPETAARREPEMDPAVIPERIDALNQLTFPGARIVTLDAEQPLPEVIRAAKREIWRLL
jgi:hypothetical protein